MAIKNIKFRFIDQAIKRIEQAITYNEIKVSNK